MMFRRLAVIAIIACASTARAEPEVDRALDAQIDRRLGERLAKLAEAHYRAGAYYRAISAYQELALFARDDATRLRAAIRIAMSYHHGRQLDDALVAYRDALALGPDEATARSLRLQRALARVERSFDQPGSEALDVVLAELGPSTAGDRRALALGARIEALAGHRAAAQRSLDELRTACVVPAPGCELAPALQKALAMPAPARRHRWLGAALSIVVPGAGSVYGGRLVDGIYYFALTSLTGLGALDVYQRERGFGDQRAAFYGLAATAAVLYLANVGSGAIAVERFNQRSALDARRALWDATEAPLPLDEVPPHAP